MWWIMLAACLPTDNPRQEGWRDFRRDPVNPVIQSEDGGMSGMMVSVVGLQDTFSAVFVDEDGAGPFIAQTTSTNGWRWEPSEPLLTGDDIVSVTHLESPNGPVIYAERTDGIWLADAGAQGPSWTELVLPDASNPEIMRLATDWMLFHDTGDHIRLAISPDGITWREQSPILIPNSDLQWMSATVGDPAVFLGPDTFWYLLFTGTDTEGVPSIGIARSRQRTGPWNINPEPILTPSTGFENARVEHPEVLLRRDVVHVWYTATDDEDVLSIGHAAANWPVWGR